MLRLVLQKLDRYAKDPRELHRVSIVPRYRATLVVAKL